MTGRDVVEETIERLRRREETGRWVVTASLSILIHIAILLLLATSALDASSPAEAEPEEIVVPLELEQPPPPQPEPVQPETQQPEPQPEAEQEPAEEKPPEDQELIGWRSQGEEPGRQDRPPGPAAEVHGPPEPSEEQGTALEPSELEDAPAGPDELEQQPGESSREERTGPAEEPPEELEESPVDPREEEQEAPPPEEPQTSSVEPQPPGELFPEPQDVPEETSEAPRRPSETDREPEPEPLPLPTPPKPRPQQEPNRGGTRKQLPGFEAEIQGGYFNQNMVFDDKNYAWSEYATKLYFAIYRAWLRELHGRVRRFERDQTLQRLPSLDGIVSIHFMIHDDGSVSAVEVVNPSRMQALDDASQAAVRRAVIPPLPDDYPKDQTGLTFSFELGGFASAQQLERQLEWSRRRGEF